MQTPLTKKRTLLLVAGVALLAAASAWRLSEQGASPPRPTPPPAPSDADEGAPAPRLAERDGVLTWTGETMGTTYSVKFAAPHEEMAALVPVAVGSALDEVVASMSTYEERSELSLVNRLGEGTAIPVSEELFFVLQLAQETTELTHGAFDVTVAPLVRAFGFGARAAKAPPSAEKLAEIRGVVGMQHLELDAARSTLEKKKSGVEIDLSAIAKGYGVDRVAAELERLDVENYMVEVGGEIRVAGTKPEGRPWRLAIEHPDPTARRIYATLQLPPEQPALATSGDYRNFREEAGEWVSHTIDPRTGSPVPRRTASVSVVRPTAAEADALATALGVLEPREALALANAHGWAVLLLVREGEDKLARLSSERFSSLEVEYVAPP